MIGLHDSSGHTLCSLLDYQRIANDAQARRIGIAAIGRIDAAVAGGLSAQAGTHILACTSERED